MFKALVPFLALAASVVAQSPTPQQAQQVQQVLQSGTAITPEMIEAVQSQVPGLQGLSDEQIRQRIDAERSDAEGEGVGPTFTDEKPADQGAGSIGEEGNPDDWRSGRRGGGGVAGLPGASRFPPGLKRFGADFFTNADVAGVGANAPALPDYRLSPGDELIVSSWGRENRSQAIVINNEGMFHYPPLSPMRIAGLKFDAAQKKITDEIEKIHGVTASVSLGRLRSIRVMVLGEAVRPGSYSLPAGATAISALVRSGGVTGIGSHRAIQIRRGGKTIATLDLYDMLLKGASKGDVQLLAGDAIFVPIAGPLVAVYGMVKRPAIYEIKGNMRALEALELAGGLQSTAFKGRVRLDRVQANKRNIVLDVDMTAPSPKTNVTLADGDVLYVDRVLNRVDDVVYLQGNVNRPGRFQYKPGMTVRDLIPSLKDLKPETFFEYAHIRRPSPDDERPTLLSFSLTDVFQSGARVPLQPRDVVIIYSRYDVVERPTVTISGTVRKPGAFPFSESMRISDLVILGGGLGDAYLPEAHLTRMLPATAGQDSLYSELIRVNLGEVLANPAGAANLELQPFDGLRVFPRENFMPRRNVAVYGAVRDEGTFEISEGMGLPEVVMMAGGLTKNSFTLGVEVARRHIEQDSVMTREIINLSLKDILEGRATFELRDGDGIYIREVVNARERTSIVLGGEFAFPGRYEFAPGEKLSSVIKRAGGFTEEAYMRGAVFLRKSVREQQLKHAEEVSRRLEGQLQARLQQTTQESERQGLMLAMNRRDQLMGEIARAPYLGRVVIKLDRDLDFAEGDWDLELEDGDNLYVGPRVSTVSVLGEVSSPTTMVYTRSTNQVGELLGRAGGVNAYGDYTETFYIGPDGSITTPRTTPWYASFRGKKVEPGGTVIVPLKPPAKDYLEIWAQSTQILYQLAITTGVVMQLYQ